MALSLPQIIVLANRYNQVKGTDEEKNFDKLVEELVAEEKAKKLAATSGSTTAPLSCKEVFAKYINSLKLNLTLGSANGDVKLFNYLAKDDKVIKHLEEIFNQPEYAHMAEVPLDISNLFQGHPELMDGVWLYATGEKNFSNTYGKIDVDKRVATVVAKTSALQKLVVYELYLVCKDIADKATPKSATKSKVTKYKTTKAKTDKTVEETVDSVIASVVGA